MLGALSSFLFSTVPDFAAFSSLFFWPALLSDLLSALSSDFWDFAAGLLLGAPVDSVTVPVVPPEPLLEPPELEELEELELSLRGPLPKKSHQTLSTLSGSSWYFSYISSTSHSLAPNPDRELSSVDSGTTSFASFNARMGEYASRLDPRCARGAEDASEWTPRVEGRVPLFESG